MENCIKSLIIREWIADDEVLYVDEAIARIEKRDANALKRIEVNHSKELDNDVLFNSIDNMIKLLQSLKAEGYTSVSQEWSGYEDNYFIADKYEMETDDEAAQRMCMIINDEIMEIQHEEELIENKKKRIKELEAELKKLKAS